MSTLALPSLSFSWPLLVTCLALLLGYEIWNLFYFKRRGIPGPTPLPLIGNIHKWGKGLHYATLEYLKYGKVCGIYFFREPVFVINDLDMIKDITVKSFSKFVNHQAFVMENKPFDKAILTLRDKHWKDVRNIITPTFSAVKMKQMSGLVNECCDTLVEHIQDLQKKDNHVECIQVFSGLSMDIIAKCAFGLQVDSQKNPDDPFVKHARVITDSSGLSLTLLLAGMCPPIGRLMNYFDVSLWPSSVTKFFSDVVDKTIALRKQGGDSKKKDFLQLLINAHEDNQQEAGDAKTEEDLHNLVDEHHDTAFFDDTKRKKMLTRDEIFGQAFLFFFAGYETTSSALSFAAYSLAVNPDVQDKLIEEIDEVAPTRDSVSYHSVAKMPYLDSVVCETLRLYPPAPATDRDCNETYSCEGLTIPAGGRVFIPIFAIHRDPELWPDPEKFDPTRFSKENREGRHPFAWMPFGAGPRNCIGMRFALMEIKMALVRLLQKYRFETTPKTAIPIKLGAMKSIKPDDGIYLGMVERS